MNPEELERLLQRVRQGKLSVEQALQRLRSLPYEDLGFASLDHHRSLRQGFPEVVLCEGKTTAQVVAIARALANDPEVVLADEPTGSLDSKAGAMVMGLLESVVRDRGATLVLVTHDASVAGRAARLVHMLDGRLADAS